MKEKSYAVLMQRQKINEHISLFFPLYLIAGTDTGQNFKDDMGDIHPYSTDSENFITEESNLSVAYIISEEELGRIMPGVPIEEAKMCYFDTITASIHVGCYTIAMDKVVFQSFNTEVLENQLANSTLEGINQEIQQAIQRPQKEEMDDSNSFTIEELIPITVSDFKKVLDISDDKKLRSVLQSMYNQFENGQLPVNVEVDNNQLYPTLLNQNLTGEKIISFFSSICERMITANSLEQISKLETNAKDSFTHIIEMLDSYGENEVAVDAATEILYRIIDSIALITTCGNINRIKLEIADVSKNEQLSIKQVATIYDECVEKFEKTIESVMGESTSSTLESVFSKKVNAKDLKDFFDRRIAGQEDAKKTIISAVLMNSLSETEEDRISCFLVGPPGSGKTLIAKTLGKYLNIPYEIIDTTQLTSPGYVGRDIEDFLARLIVKAGGDLKKAESGIVVFDELDKKGSDKKSDISGKAVLNTLLPFFEGTDYEVKNGKEKVTFNTSKLTIFATGACADIAKAKLHHEGLGSYKKTRIGFTRDISTTEEDFVYPELEPEDFSNYGGISEELIGRITTICQLSGHTVESLKFILTNIETSALLLLQKKLSKIGITLSWTEEYLDAVAHKAIKLKTGARSLKSTVEKSVKEARWEVLMEPDKYTGILLTPESVENPFECKLIDKDGNTFTVKEFQEQSQNIASKVKKIGSLE